MNRRNFLRRTMLSIATTPALFKLNMLKSATIRLQPGVYLKESICKYESEVDGRFIRHENAYYSYSFVSVTNAQTFPLREGKCTITYSPIVYPVLFKRVKEYEH